MAKLPKCSPWQTLNKPFGAHPPVPAGGPNHSAPPKPAAPPKAGTKGK